MKCLLSILILLFLSEYFFGQQDEAIRDTIVTGKIFHVIMYTEDKHVACVGSYIPNTFIRTGEWDYFYSDGKVCSKTFFKLDRKIGNWIYYDEQGNIIGKMNTRRKIKDEEVPITSVFYEDAQQNRDAFNKQFEDVRAYFASMMNYSLYRNIYVGRRHRHFS